jgi:serine protease Do
MSTRKSPIFYGTLIALASLVVGMVLASRLGLTPASVASTFDTPAANNAPISGPIDATTFRTIASQAGPSVVSISIVAARRAGPSLGEFFGFQVVPPDPRGRRPVPADPDGVPDVLPATGAGSGFIIDKSGLVLTNNHVVADARSIEVRLAGMDDLEAGLSAKVIGRDELTDTALLQITEMPREPLVEAKFGDSTQIAPGDWVMAIGNPFALSNTVTVGVVSAVGRLTQGAASGRYEEMIQTDAAINRGNSGGPLLNIRGEVIGINTKILTDDGTGNVGVGFAIPINTVRGILPQLREGKVSRGRIGVSVDRRPITADLAANYGLPTRNGAIVSDVVPGGPAATAGVRIEDVIVEFNGQPVTDDNRLVSIVTRTAPGTTVPVKLYRDRKLMTVNVKVDELNLADEQEQLAARRGRAPERETRPQPKETAFGMSIDAITPAIARQLGLESTRGGAVVSAVDPFGAAAQGGIQRGDVILRIDGRTVSTVDEVSAALDRVQTGNLTRIVVSRGGRENLQLVRKR